jgi:hypothetical protein
MRFLEGRRAGIFCDQTVPSVLCWRNDFCPDRGRKRHFAALPVATFESPGVSLASRRWPIAGLHKKIDVERESLYGDSRQIISASGD